MAAAEQSTDKGEIIQKSDLIPEYDNALFTSNEYYNQLFNK